jgi:hypothetical protein
VKVAAEEVKPFPTLLEVHDPRLVWMQLEPQISEDLPRDPQRLVRLMLAVAERDPIVRIADERADTPRDERTVERVQVDVRQKRLDHAAI